MSMSDEEIRLESARKLADDRQSLANSAETTPLEITPAIEAFCDSLGGRPLERIRVIDDANGRYGWCSDGVRLKVAADGGAPVYGWTIWEWPPGLLTAEFHCVWKAPGGELLDITPKPQRETEIVFVADPTYGADFDFDQRPRNRRACSYASSARKAKLDALRAGLAGPRLAYEHGRAAKAGMDLDAWLDFKMPKDPLVRAIEDFIVLCGEFEEHFDSLGSSGMVRADNKLMALVKRRMAAQRRLVPMMRQAAGA